MDYMDSVKMWIFHLRVMSIVLMLIVYQLKSSLTPQQSKTIDHFGHFLNKKNKHCLIPTFHLWNLSTIFSLLISIFVGFDQRKQRMLMTSLMSESQMWCFSQKNENFIFIFRLLPFSLILQFFKKYVYFTLNQLDHTAMCDH